MIYLFILVILLFGFLFEEKMKRRGTRFLWYFSFMYLTALSAFGYRIGADMPAYIGEFDFYKIDFSPSYLFSFHRRQPLWVLLCVWCKSLGGGFEMLKKRYENIQFDNNDLREKDYLDNLVYANNLFQKMYEYYNSDRIAIFIIVTLHLLFYPIFK